MTFHYDPALLTYMEEKGHQTICVEVVTANADIDCTELYVHFVKPGQADEFVRRKKYRPVETERGRVLLPPYVLEYDEDVFFFLKKTWVFRSVGFSGIRL